MQSPGQAGPPASVASSTSRSARCTPSCSAGGGCPPFHMSSCGRDKRAVQVGRRSGGKAGGLSGKHEGSQAGRRQASARRRGGRCGEAGRQPGRRPRRGSRPRPPPRHLQRAAVLPVAPQPGQEAGGAGALAGVRDVALKAQVVPEAGAGPGQLAPHGGTHQRQHARPAPGGGGGGRRVQRGWEAGESGVRGRARQEAGGTGDGGQQRWLRAAVAAAAAGRGRATRVRSCPSLPAAPLTSAGGPPARRWPPRRSWAGSGARGRAAGCTMLPHPSWTPGNGPIARRRGFVAPSPAQQAQRRHPAATAATRPTRDDWLKLAVAGCASEEVAVVRALVGRDWGQCMPAGCKPLTTGCPSTGSTPSAHPLVGSGRESETVIFQACLFTNGFCIIVGAARMVPGSVESLPPAAPSE